MNGVSDSANQDIFHKSGAHVTYSNYIQKKLVIQFTFGCILGITQLAFAYSNSFSKKLVMQIMLLFIGTFIG